MIQSHLELLSKLLDVNDFEKAKVLITEISKLLNPEQQQQTDVLQQRSLQSVTD